MQLAQCGTACVVAPFVFLFAAACGRQIQAQTSCDRAALEASRANYPEPLVVGDSLLDELRGLLNRFVVDAEVQDIDSSSIRINESWRADSLAVQGGLARIIFDQATFGGLHAMNAAAYYAGFGGRPEPIIAYLRYEDGLSGRVPVALSAVRGKILDQYQPALRLLACDAVSALAMVSLDRERVSRYFNGRRELWIRDAGRTVGEVIRLGGPSTRDLVRELLKQVDPRLIPGSTEE